MTERNGMKHEERRQAAGEKTGPDGNAPGGSPVFDGFWVFRADGLGS